MIRAFPTIAVLIALIISHLAFAQSPSIKNLTIKGKTLSKFNRVALFEGGRSKRPFKVESVSSTGKYSISVSIPSDMRQKQDYLYTDMRFWNDKNGNGIKDSGEPKSECHFIIYVPSIDRLYLQVYKGDRYDIDSSVFVYNYRK
jgi:hypothetical protein